MPSEVYQLAWATFNDCLEKAQELKSTAIDYKTFVVASIYLAIQFLKESKMTTSKIAEEEKGSSDREAALVKFKTLSARCMESKVSREEGTMNYAEFQERNKNWWEKHFGIKEEQLAEAIKIALSNYT